MVESFTDSDYLPPLLLVVVTVGVEVATVVTLFVPFLFLALPLLPLLCFSSVNSEFEY